MSEIIPNMQVLVDALAIKYESLDVELDSGLVRVDTANGDILYSQGARSIQINIGAPALGDGYQIDAWGAIVNGRDVEVKILVAGAKIWTGAGVVKTSNMSQSANDAQKQTAVIECPLKRVPK